MRLLLLSQVLQRPAEVAAAQQLPHKRVGGAHTQVRGREAVAVGESQQQQQDGPEFFVHGLVFALVLLVPGPVVEQLAQRVQDLLRLVKEEEDVQGQGLAGQLAAQLLERHRLLIPAEAPNDLRSGLASRWSQL